MLLATEKLEDWAKAIQQELQPLMASPVTEECVQRTISHLKNLGFYQCSGSELHACNQVSPPLIGAHGEDDIYYLIAPKSADTKTLRGVAFTSYMDRNKPWLIQFFDSGSTKQEK